MWCMLAAPLMAGNDLRNMSKEPWEILANTEVIAVDQDPLGIQGFNIPPAMDWKSGSNPSSDGAWAMCVLNRSTTRTRRSRSTGKPRR